MILKPFFRRHFLLTSLVFILVLTLASYLSHYLSHMEHSGFFQTQGSEILTAVEKRSDKLAYVKEVNASNQELGIPLELDLVQNGKSLVTGKDRLVNETTATEQRLFVHDINLPEPAKFVLAFNSLRQPRRGLFSITFIVMCLATLIASALSMFLLFWSIRDKAELAKNILTRMQKGELKARFPTSRLDEASHMMALFNQMADEIERLVEQLKQNEQHRLQLLQELTHDLRTPVSSLRNLIETLRFDESRLQAKAKAELTELAFQETEYLTRLVEDLLFLALVLEPKYKHESSEVFVQELVLAQLSAVAAGYPDVKSDLIHSLAGRRNKITGTPHLMQRLFRNALDNAFSFANSEVQVKLSESDGLLKICVRDDGPGFSAQALETFGQKRSTRYQGPRQDGRISVGLGSVIIQAITTAHGGSVEVRNRIDVAGNILGAELTIVIRTEQNSMA